MTTTDKAKDAPLVDPDPSKLEPALEGTLVTVGPFLPPKVRATIYTVGGAGGAVCVALGPLLGGTLGDVLGLVGAACIAATSATALSHVSP